MLLTRHLGTDETGAVAMFTAVMVLALFATIGLVLAGGQKVTALREATNVADNAARAGAQHVEADSLHGDGPPQLDITQAAAAANSYLTLLGRTGTAVVSGDTITVTVTITYQPVVLPTGPVTVSATESATLRIEEG